MNKYESKKVKVSLKNTNVNMTSNKSVKGVEDVEDNCVISSDRRNLKVYWTDHPIDLRRFKGNEEKRNKISALVQNTLLSVFLLGLPLLRSAIRYGIFRYIIWPARSNLYSVASIGKNEVEIFGLLPFRKFINILDDNDNKIKEYQKKHEQEQNTILNKQIDNSYELYGTLKRLIQTKYDDRKLSNAQKEKISAFDKNIEQLIKFKPSDAFIKLNGDTNSNSFLLTILPFSDEKYFKLLDISTFLQEINKNENLSKEDKKEIIENAAKYLNSLSFNEIKTSNTNKPESLEEKIKKTDEYHNNLYDYLNKKIEKIKKLDIENDTSLKELRENKVKKLELKVKCENEIELSNKTMDNIRSYNENLFKILIYLYGKEDSEEHYNEALNDLDKFTKNIGIKINKKIKLTSKGNKNEQDPNYIAEIKNCLSFIKKENTFMKNIIKNNMNWKKLSSSHKEHLNKLKEAMNDITNIDDNIKQKETAKKSNSPIIESIQKLMKGKNKIENNHEDNQNYDQYKSYISALNEIIDNIKNGKNIDDFRNITKLSNKFVGKLGKYKERINKICNAIIQESITQVNKNFSEVKNNITYTMNSIVCGFKLAEQYTKYGTKDICDAEVRCRDYRLDSNSFFHKQIMSLVEVKSLQQPPIQIVSTAPATEVKPKTQKKPRVIRLYNFFGNNDVPESSLAILHLKEKIDSLNRLLSEKRPDDPAVVVGVNVVPPELNHGGGFFVDFDQITSCIAAAINADIETEYAKNPNNPPEILLDAYSLGGAIATKVAWILTNEYKKDVFLNNRASFLSISGFISNTKNTITKWFSRLLTWGFGVELDVVDNYNDLPEDHKFHIVNKGDTYSNYLKKTKTPKIKSKQDTDNPDNSDNPDNPNNADNIEIEKEIKNGAEIDGIIPYKNSLHVGIAPKTKEQKDKILDFAEAIFYLIKYSENQNNKGITLITLKERAAGVLKKLQNNVDREVEGRSEKQEKISAMTRYIKVLNDNSKYVEFWFKRYFPKELPITASIDNMQIDKIANDLDKLYRMMFQDNKLMRSHTEKVTYCDNSNARKFGIEKAGIVPKLMKKLCPPPAPTPTPTLLETIFNIFTWNAFKQKNLDKKDDQSQNNSLLQELRQLFPGDATPGIHYLNVLNVILNHAQEKEQNKVKEMNDENKEKEDQDDQDDIGNKSSSTSSYNKLKKKMISNDNDQPPSDNNQLSSSQQKITLNQSQTKEENNPSHDIDSNNIKNQKIQINQ